MTVKFPLMFVVSFVATDISRTKGLFYAFNAMGGRNLKPKLDYKASKKWNKREPPAHKGQNGAKVVVLRL